MAWSEAEIGTVTQALAVVCEVTGTSLSDPAKRFMLQELQTHPAKEVVRALRECSRAVKGKLALADVVKQLEHVDRKALSDARAARQYEESQLRICALKECIAWNRNDLDDVRRQLNAKGYKFTLRGAAEPPKALPHWTETDAE